MHSLIAAAGQVAGALGEPNQDSLLAARQMQAMSFIVHIPLVCFGIAFPAMVLFAEWLWLRTGDRVYLALAKRWSQVMVLLFAVGVVTGTILSFEFGLLWPNLTATFGDVFGLAFTLEGFSFFIEAIFIAIYVYGWDKLPARKHFLLGIPIVISGVTGSLTVLSVNSWMNNPAGFDLVGGQVTNVDPWAAIFNDHLGFEMIHMYFAGYMVAGFIAAGVYAWGWLHGRRDRYHRAGLIITLTFAALVAPLQPLIGDWAAREVAKDQPVKLAAFEGLQRTTDGAGITIGGIYLDDEVKYGIRLPKMLSLLAFHDPEATVRGLEEVPEADRPPVNVTRFSFQAMVAIGTGLALLSALYLATWWRRRRLPQSRLFYWAVVASGPAALIALLAGWITTEVGRQPWVVYEVMRTEQAVTDAGGLPYAFAVLAAIFVALIGSVVWLLRRLGRHRPEVDWEERGDAA